MTEIINGVYRTNEQSTDSNGGTEQMAKRMVRDIPSDLLEGYQIIHSRVRGFEPNLKKILVCHDLHGDNEVADLADPEFRNQFEKIVFVSNWQLQMYNLSLGVPYSKSVVIPNGIEAIPFKEKDYSGTIRLIYHTTPHRGLAILYAVVEKLASEGFDIHLDVFSSYDIYGSAWSWKNEAFEPLYEKIRNHPNMTYHGSKPNEVVREYLQNTHIFAYPSVWPETSCIAAIEAMCAGNFVVHPNFAALPETMGRDGIMYQFDEDMNSHANIFYQQLGRLIINIQNNKESASHSSTIISERANIHYNWNNSILPRWNSLLTELKK